MVGVSFALALPAPLALAPRPRPPSPQSSLLTRPRCLDRHVEALLLPPPRKLIQDAMLVARNVFLNPRLLPGGGAVDMAISTGLRAKSTTISGVDRLV